MRTGAVTGEIDLSASTASLVIDLHTLESDATRRDNYIRTRLFPSQRETTIKFSDFPDIPESFANGDVYINSSGHRER